MERKIDRLRALIAAGDRAGALRMAARFPVLGAAKADIVRGHEALAHPAFYRQLGRDPAALAEAGWAALRARYAPSGSGANEASGSGPSAS